MPTWDDEYRGYRISYQRGDRFAWILPPTGGLALNEIPQADLGEGRHELRAKAMAIIDADIASIKR